MPVTTIPLIGPETRRGLALSVSTSKDQYFGNCVFTRAINNATNSSEYWVQKRPGVGTLSTPSSGNRGEAIWVSPSTSSIITIFNNGVIYENTTNVGTASDGYWINEVIIGGITFYLFGITPSGVGGQGWYLASDASSDTSFTGDTHTNTTIDNIAGASGVYVGQLISGTGIQANTRIATRTPDTSTPTSITTTLATTATNAGVTITKTPIAKIIDTDFPALWGGFAALDGFLFVVTGDGKVYNSDLNSITSWTPNNFITANLSTDGKAAIIQNKNKIIVFGDQSLTFFENTGNQSGSVLSNIKDLFSNVGVAGAAANTSKNIFKIVDDLFWIGNDQCLYTMNGFSPENISKQSMMLASIGASSNKCSGFRLGRDIYISADKSDGVNWWFSKDIGAFSEITYGGTITLPTFSNAIGPTSAGVVSYFVCNDTSGKIYTLDTTLYQDNGSAFTMTIQTEPYYFNKGLPFIIDNITLLADTQSSGSSTLSATADDYANFTTIGSFDLTQQQKNLAGGGYYDSSVAFKLTDAGNNAWRGQALQVTWRPYQ